MFSISFPLIWLVEFWNLFHMSRQEGESKDILIKHLRAELDDLKASNRKMEELNSAAAALEINYKILKEEKEKIETEGHSKANAVSNGLTEAESELELIRDELTSASKVRNELITTLNKLKADLDILEQKEQTAEGKLKEMDSFIEEGEYTKQQLEEDINARRREVAELKNRLDTVEKDQLSLDERISKMRLNKSNQMTLLIDLDGERAQIERIRADRLKDRERLSNQYAVKEDELAESNDKLGSLREKQGLITAEIKRMQIAAKEIEIKCLEEEDVREQISANISTREGQLKEINDHIHRERQLKDKSTSRINDEIEISEKLANDSEKLNTALKRISDTYSRVTNFSKN